MPKKIVNEATIAPPPLSDGSVKKTSKPAAPRRQAAPKIIVETPNTSIAHLADAVKSPSAVDARDIEERAYQSWIERGCPMGSPEEDWYRAEQDLIVQFATVSK